MVCCQDLVAVAERYSRRYYTGEVIMVAVKSLRNKGDFTISVGTMQTPVDFKDGVAHISNERAQELISNLPGQFEIVEDPDKGKKADAHSGSSMDSKDGTGKGNDVGDGS